MMNQDDDFPLKEEGRAILGAVFEVYKEMGCGFLEAVYQECLEREMGSQSIPFKAKAILNIPYKGENLKQFYQPDFICYDKIILELKAVTQLAAEHRAQMHNYLKATGMQVGYLINFGHYPKVEFERIIRSGNRPQNKQNMQKGKAEQDLLP